MHIVYSRAKQVLLWLGESADRSDEAFKWIKAEPKRSQFMFEQLTKVTREIPNLFELLNAEGPNGPTNAAMLKRIQVPGIKPEYIEPVFALQMRPYFARVWVIQETFHAKKIEVHCGGDSVDWDIFVSACHSFWHTSTPPVRKLWPQNEGYFPGPQKLAATRELKKKLQLGGLGQSTQGYQGAVSNNDEVGIQLVGLFNNGLQPESFCYL